KRRRRGGRGRRRGEAEGAAVEAVAPVAKATPRETPAVETDGLLGRIKKGLKGLINRLPGRGRQR
ncbi:MAG: hypothetical protein LW860_02130, partial [Xanthomonadaceae bacterium]|nr:hypothetical protein [Xanthomonadaceae bacterium]